MRCHLLSGAVRLPCRWAALFLLVAAAVSSSALQLGPPTAPIVGGLVDDLVDGLGTLIASLNPLIQTVDLGLVSALEQGDALTAVPNSVVTALTTIFAALSKVTLPNSFGDEPHVEAAKFGLQGEKYTVQTEDGYLLDAFRIRSNCSSTKRVVIMPQGIMSNAASLILLRDKSLGYRLARQCCDVWLVSFRGSRWGRRHITLSPDSNEFWNWDAVDWGEKDLPAWVTFISDKTGSNQTRLVGVDIAGTALIGMASERDAAFQQRIGRAYFFAPIIYLRYFKSPAFAALALGRDVIRGVGAVALKNSYPFGDPILHDPLHFFCTIARNTCKKIFILLGGITDEFSAEDLPYFLLYPLDSLSVKSFNFFLQMIGKEKYLKKFDYGVGENQRRYGSDTPPSLNISKLIVPTSVYAMGKSSIATAKDVEEAYADLPSVAQQRYNLIPTFNALSSFGAVHPELLNDLVIQHMEEDFATDGLPACSNVCT